jgi:hypothetical protein
MISYDVAIQGFIVARLVELVIVALLTNNRNSGHKLTPALVLRANATVPITLSIIQPINYL